MDRAILVDAGLAGIETILLFRFQLGVGRGISPYELGYYGVDAAYATPQRPAYRARGGYAGWRALTALSRRVGSVWMGAFVRYDSLRGAVFADSPLVRRDHEVTAGIGVSWVFATSSQLVGTDD